MDHALHAYRLENERKELEKKEARKRKMEEKKKEMLVEQVGEGGEVKSQTIKYTGNFDLPQLPESAGNDIDEEMIETEASESYVKSQRKNGFEISRRYFPVGVGVRAILPRMKPGPWIT